MSNEELREADEFYGNRTGILEARIVQLEEALRFYADKKNWYEDSLEGDSWEGVWWRGNHYRRGWQLARAALSREPGEASQKDRCRYQSGSSALGQCKLEAGHSEDCAFEFSEAPREKEEE